MKALLDADVVAYRAAAVAEREGMDLLAAVALAEDLVFEWTQKAGASEYLLAFSHGRSFRYEVYPLYKHNRKGKPHPPLLAEVRAYLMAHHPSRFLETLEGDDIMGILLTKEPGTWVAVTNDKDLRQVPGHHLNPDKEDAPCVVTEAEADYYRNLQWVMGDTADGYPGIPGVGPKKAAALLADQTPKEIYEAKGLAESCEAMRLVSRILRWSDVDQQTWLPAYDLEGVTPCTKSGFVSLLV